MTIEEIQNELRRVEVDRARALVRRDRLNKEAAAAADDCQQLETLFWQLNAALVEAVKHEGK